MPDFSSFDRRHYRTVGAAEGYDAWAPTYERTVEDAMDLELLDRVASVDWPAVTRVADLGCGSGRTAAWLRTKGAFPIDGIDLTPAMLELARRRGLHEHLVLGDVRATGLPGADYDVVTCVLVDEHLPDLGPLYAEARRLLRDAGALVLVGVHPHFLMAVGMPTHFEGPDGEPVAIETHLHLPGEHVAAAGAAGLIVRELHEGLVGDELVRSKPSWEAYRGIPFTYAWVFATA